MKQIKYNGDIHKFHGLSTPEDLKAMWRELKHDDDQSDLNVIFDYESPEQLKEGFNILNILYDPEHSKEIGHYVLFTNLPNYKEYFDPVPSNTNKFYDKIKDIVDYLKNDILISMEGKQQLGTKDCGYHCLAHAFNIYNSKHNVSGKLPENPTKQDILLDILRLNRGIYYQLKNIADNKTISTKLKIQKNKGAGLADDIPKSKLLHNFSYSEMKDIIED
jgi:hypothetical protein